MIPSIGSVGDANDNALAETTIGLYKTECVRDDSPFRIGPLDRLRDVAPKKQLRSTEQDVGNVACIQYPWAAADAYGGPSKTILRVLDMQTGQVAREWSAKGSLGLPDEIAITPDGKRVVALFSGTLRYWDVATHATRKLPTSSDRFAWSIAVTADGRYAVIARHSGELEVCDLKRRAVQILAAHTGGVTNVAAFGLTNAVSAGADGTVKVWDLAVPEELAVLPIQDPPTCIACSATGSTILVGARWGNVHALRFVAP
jgi:WD40 repeat protein